MQGVPTLPLTKADLSYIYYEDDETAVSSDNGIRVALTSSESYLVHQYRAVNDTVNDNIHVKINLQTNRAPSTATVYLQVWNTTNLAWETLDSDNSTAVSTDFDLDYTLSSNLTQYYDTSYEVAFRVYQATGGSSKTLSVDLVEICFLTVYTDVYTETTPTYTDTYTSTTPTYVDKYETKTC